MTDYAGHPRFGRMICATCGTEFPTRAALPEVCPTCADERQYVGMSAQVWITPEQLAYDHSIRFANEDGVVTLALEPAFAIGQRACLIPSEDGFVMWECLSIVTKDAITRIREMGGVKAIAISHPHFYAAMVTWSEALGGVPIFLHEADRRWVHTPSARIVFWNGERRALAGNLELVHLPGHFDGSAGLWWKTGPRAGGSLFPGDAIQVALARGDASFMYSYPNAIPLGPAALARLETCLAPLEFEDVFGFARGRQIIGRGREWVTTSFARRDASIAA